MPEKTNQQKLDDIWWILCAPDGRPAFVDMIGSRAADLTLNTPIPRGGEGVEGMTNLAGMVSWNDSHVIAILSSVAASSAQSGATTEQIEAAVRKAIQENIVKVDVKVEGAQQ